MPTFEITAPDGRVYDVEGPDAQGALAALTKALGAAPQKQQMVGFGERAQRELDMPLDAEGERELDITKRMARQRQSRSGFNEAVNKGVLQSLNDEAGGALAGLIEGPYRAGQKAKTDGIMSGLASIPGQIAEVYDRQTEAERRLGAEYAQAHPVAATLGEVAGSLAAPRLFAKDPVGIKGQIGQNVAEGLVYGALGGFGEGQGLEDSIATAGKGAAIGGGVGIAAPALLAGGGYATRKIGGSVIDGARVLMGKADRVAEGKVAGTLAQDMADGSMRLTDREFARARRNGQDVRLLDKGGNATMALGDSADVLSPQARGGMREVSQNRFENQSERLGEQYGRIGGHADDLATEDALSAAAKAANDRNYEVAYKAGSRDLWDDELSSLMESDAVQEALRKAISKQRNRRAATGRNVRSFTPRVTVDEQSGRILFQKGDVHSYPDLELWDLTKRELDQLASAARARGLKDDAGMYGDLAKRLRNHLTDLVPEYARARGTAAVAFDAEDALDAGRKLATSTDPAASRKLARVWNKMTDAEKKLFRQGYTATRRDQMRGVGKNVNAANKIQNSPEQKMRDQIVLGRRAALLSETKKVEDVMQQTKQIFGNSKTAQRLNDMAMAGLGSAAGGYEGGDWQSMTLGGLAGLGARKGKMRLDQSVANHVARILTTSDPKQIEQLVLLAQRSPKVADALEAATRSITRIGSLTAPRAGIPVLSGE